MNHAHPAPARRFSCPGCATCSEARRRERVWAALVLAVLLGWFVVPVLADYLTSGAVLLFVVVAFGLLLWALA